MEDIAAAVENLKLKGNNAFRQFNYAAAIEHYSSAVQALEASPNPKLLAVLLSNRAQCHIKLQNYGIALEDSKKAVAADANFLKAYYRQGSAFLVLGKYEDSINSFNQALVLSGGTDADLQFKINQVKRLYNTFKKAQKARLFAEAIAGGGAEKDIDALAQLGRISDIEVPVTYDGPRLEAGQTINSEWVESLMEYLMGQKKLHRKYVLQLLGRSREVLMSQKTLMELRFAECEITVCGDVHGQFYDLLNIFKLNGLPSPSNPYLFNGDFVDRGSFSIEIILTLLAWKVCLPKSFFLNRGNHQAVAVNKIYGFEGQTLAKYDNTIYELFSEVFRWLPLATVINERVFVCHGGLFQKDGVTLADIASIDRHREPPQQGIYSDLLWADPIATNGREPSKRGIGLSFGPDVTKRFLEQNKLGLVVRSHEVRANGYQVEQGGQLITVFSAPNYCDQMGNKGAFLRINPAGEAKPTVFSAVPHPNIPVMAYASRLGGLF